MSTKPGFAFDSVAPAGPAATTAAGNMMFLTELMMCVIIIGVVAYLATDEYSDRVRAVRLSDPMMRTGTYRNLWIEEHAHIGVAPADSAAYDRVALGEPVTRSLHGTDALGTVSGLEALRARAAQGVEAVDEAPAATAGKGSANAIVGISDGVPMAVVHPRHLAHPVIFELRPALQSTDAPVVRWLCDEGPPPAGWSAPPARTPRPPEELLPSVCRKGWKP